MTFARSLFVILVPVLLSCSGCSKVTFGYNHADWLMRYWINGYTSFDARQKEEIRREVADYMRWHRRNALPEYIGFLHDLNGLANRDGVLTAADIVRLRAESGRLYRMTMAPLIRPAARVLSTLDSRQIEELRETLADRNREQKEETLFDSEQENLAKRAERHIDGVEGLVGRLSREQKKAIREISLRVPFATGYYIEQREAKQAALIALLNEHAGEDRIAALFRQWIEIPDASWSPQQKQAIEAYESAMNEMSARIFELMTPHQKDHIRKRIADYIDAFQELHAATETVDAAHEPR